VILKPLPHPSTPIPAWSSVGWKCTATRLLVSLRASANHRMALLPSRTASLYRVVGRDRALASPGGDELRHVRHQVLKPHLAERTDRRVISRWVSALTGPGVASNPSPSVTRSAATSSSASGVLRTSTIRPSSTICVPRLNSQLSSSTVRTMASSTAMSPVDSVHQERRMATLKKDDPCFRFGNVGPRIKCGQKTVADGECA